MRYELISGDNHIDLTYCPPDLWSSQAPPAKWRLLVPRVEELEDGLHWFVEGPDPVPHAAVDIVAEPVLPVVALLDARHELLPFGRRL